MIPLEPHTTLVNDDSRDKVVESNIAIPVIGKNSRIFSMLFGDIWTSLDRAGDKIVVTTNPVILYVSVLDSTVSMKYLNPLIKIEIHHLDKWMLRVTMIDTYAGKTAEETAEFTFIIDRKN